MSDDEESHTCTAVLFGEGAAVVQPCFEAWAGLAKEQRALRRAAALRALNPGLTRGWQQMYREAKRVRRQAALHALASEQMVRTSQRDGSRASMTPSRSGTLMPASFRTRALSRFSRSSIPPEQRRSDCAGTRGGRGGLD